MQHLRTDKKKSNRRKEEKKQNREERDRERKEESDKVKDKSNREKTEIEDKLCPVLSKYLIYYTILKKHNHGGRTYTQAFTINVPFAWQR